MTKKLKLLIVMSFACLPCMAYSQNYDMSEVNEKIDAIADKRIHVIETSIDEANLITSPEFNDLLTKCKAEWESIADNFTAIDGHERKRVLVWGMGDLEAADYASFLEKLVTKFEADQIPEDVIEDAFSPHGRMRAFIIDNHAHQRIVALLNRTKTKAENAQFKDSLDDILSGEDKTSLDEYRESHEGLPQGNIPKVLLP